MIDITVQAAAGILLGAKVRRSATASTSNDVAFRTTFPYLAQPHSGGLPWKLNPVVPH